MDSHLFEEIILTEGAILAWTDPDSGSEIIKAFIGLNGKRVFMDLTEEELSKPIIDEYLTQLGMSELIGLL